MKMNHRIIIDSLKKKVLAGVLAGSAVMFLASPYMPVAAADAVTASGQQMNCETNNTPGHFGMKNHIDKLVTEGTITQTQADKLEAAMKDFHQKQRQERKDFMSSLSDTTGISQDTLKQIFKQPRHAHMNPERVQQRMAKLVQDGKVTQTEATALQNYFQNHKPGEFKKDQNGKKGPKEMMQNISSETGISTDRLKEIMHMVMPPMGPGPQQRMAKLVQDGKVTQAEADALSTFHKNHSLKGHDHQKMNRDEVLKTMSGETGISADRLKEIMKMMHEQKMNPPQNNAGE